MDNVTYLSDLDRWVSNRLCYFFYDGIVDPNFLKTRVENGVKSLPILSSVIQSEVDEEGNKRYFFKHISPSNIVFYEKEVDDEVYDNYNFQKSVEEHGIFTEKCDEEGYRLQTLAECVEVGKNPRMDVIENVPLVKITLLYTKSSQKTIVAVSINHATSDLTGFLMFMNSVLNGKVVQFDYSRHYFKKTDKNFDLSKCEDHELIQKYRSHLPIPSIRNEYDEWTPCKDKGYLKLIYFSRERCEELKKLVKSESTQRISSFDCISAHIYKLHAVRLKNIIPDDEIVPLSILINMRHRHPELGPNFFGNCIMIPSFEMTKREIIEISFSDLVFKIRGLVQSVTEKDLTFFMNAYKLDSVRNRRHTLHLNDWRIVDRLNYDVIHSEKRIKCDRVVLYPPSSPNHENGMFYGFTRYRMDLSEKNELKGIHVRVTIRDSFLQKIGFKTDLSSPHILDQILKRKDL